MNLSQLLGLPLDRALSLCAAQGFQPVVVETRSPREGSPDSRYARVVAVRQDAGKSSVIVAFFSAEGPKEPSNAAE